MIYLMAQPAIKYYAWQIDVSIRSMLEQKVKPEQIHIVSGLQNGIKHEDFNTLETMFPAVNFNYYHDNRKDLTYAPSIRPHILKKHWRKFPQLESKQVFYMEADVCLVRPLDKTNFNSKTWFLSDTVSYIGHDYIKGRDKRFLKLFADIVGIDVKAIRSNQNNSGGAQWVMSSLTEAYWEKVEKDCVEIYKKGEELNEVIRLENPEWHPLQIWTACMWAGLYNAWYFGHETKVDPELEFTWATDPKKYIGERRIYHNAGATSDHEGILIKSDYTNETPFGKKLKINNDFAGAWYYSKIQKASKETLLK